MLKRVATEMMELSSVEIRRRSGVVGLLPSVASCVLAAIRYFFKHAEDWEDERSDMRED